KSDTTVALDPLTNQTVHLFNPRTQNWDEHFSWNVDFTKIQGLTPVGRVTVITLKMNNPLVVEARFRWTINGWHPPSFLGER
ncbi:MAG: HNH endonuclease, partial [Moorea sp. SIO2I5]|nr:HNH endonuclease [Moorena sp. SIO2I5]